MNIGEVSKQFHISCDTLRYYEKIGLVGPISKNTSGIRKYTEEDLKQIEFVICMRNANISVEALLQYLELYKLGDSTIKERKNILISELEKVNQELEKILQAKKRIEYKISLYDNQLLEKELDE